MKKEVIKMETQLRKNIPKIYIYGFFLNFLVMIPILVPYWQSKGLTLKDIFLLQGIFGAALIIFDAPAGYCADLFGRKKLLIMGSAVSALGYQILWFGNTFLDFAIFEAILGLGLSLQAGCDVAILYNSLEKTDYNGSKAKILGTRIMSMTVGEGVASLLCGLLAGVSLNLPVQVNAVTAWIPVFIAMTLKDSGQNLSRESHLKNFKLIGRALFGHSRLLTMVILSFIFYGFATYCAVWSMQPYWESRGLNVSVFGYLWAINSFMVALVSRYAHVIEERIGSTRSILIIAIMPVIGYIGMGATPGFFGILFILAFPICRGLNQVLFQDAINTRVPAEMRATTNSVGSLGMRTLFLIFGPLLGATLDTRGPDQAMLVMGAVYVVGFFAIALPLLSQRRYFRTS
jgi:MFS family permease